MDVILLLLFALSVGAGVAIGHEIAAALIDHWRKR